jgi:hypothetical protein
MIGQKGISVSGFIEETRFTIFGYTCKKCQVELTNPYVYAKTVSDEKGYFLFDRVLIPKKYSDLCLIPTDKHGQQSTPTCIASPPASNYHTDIGPILLAPSINIDKNKASGESIPNATISVHFFKENNKGRLAPKEALAYSLPAVNASTDSEGYFNFNIPSVYQSNFRLYVNAIFQENTSARSNVLRYHLPIYNDYFYFLILPLFILLFTFLFRAIYAKYLHIRFLPAIIKSWPMLRNIQLSPFSSSR